MAHSLNKKIYITLNTILKAKNKLEDCKNFIKSLYESGVDGLIHVDYSMVNYVIANFHLMEAHIST